MADSYVVEPKVDVTDGPGVSAFGAKQTCTIV